MELVKFKLKLKWKGFFVIGILVNKHAHLLDDWTKLFFTELNLPGKKRKQIISYFV